MCGVMWVIVLLVDLTIVVSWGGGWNQETGFDLGMSLYWPWSWNYPNFDLSWHVLFAIPVKHFDYSQYHRYESNHAALTLTFIHCCGDLDMHSLQTFPHKSQHYYISKNSIIGLKLQLFSTYKESNMATVTLTLTKETPYFCEENTYLPFQCIPNLILIHHGILILFLE